jgi:hypothetical protein
LIGEGATCYVNSHFLGGSAQADSITLNLQRLFCHLETRRKAGSTRTDLEELQQRDIREFLRVLIRSLEEKLANLMPGRTKYPPKTCAWKAPKTSPIFRSRQGTPDGADLAEALDIREFLADLRPAQPPGCLRCAGAEWCHFNDSFGVAVDAEDRLRGRAGRRDRRSLRGFAFGVRRTATPKIGVKLTVYTQDGVRANAQQSRPGSALIGFASEAASPPSGSAFPRTPLRLISSLKAHRLFAQLRAEDEPISRVGLICGAILTLISQLELLPSSWSIRQRPPCKGCAATKPGRACQTVR